MYGGVQLNVQPAFNEFVLIFNWCFILTKGDENKYIGYLKRTCKERWKGTKKTENAIKTKQVRELQIKIESMFPVKDIEMLPYYSV